MPVYTLLCEQPHDGKGPLEVEAILASWRSENPPCELCGGPVERVLRGRQHHGELSGWPLVTRAITGELQEFRTLRDYERAVDKAGLRIRDDSSWLDETPAVGAWDWRSRSYKHQSTHAVRGGKGSW